MIEGASFQHPGLRFAFEAPPGFRLQNSPDAVAGSDGAGRIMLFDMAEGVGRRPARLPAAGLGHQPAAAGSADASSCDGPAAAVGFGQVAVGGGPARAMFAVVGGRWRQGATASSSPTVAGSTATMSPRSTRACGACARLSAAEAASHRARCACVIVPVNAGDTHRQFCPADAGRARSARLVRPAQRSGSRPHAAPGDRVKVIRQDPVRRGWSRIEHHRLVAR